MTAKEKIQSLISAASNTTGTPLADLTSAVSALIDGYGGGSPIRTDSGDFRLTTASANPQLEDATIYEPREIKHNLGVIPSIVCIWGDGVTSTNIATAVIFSLGTDHNEDPDFPERAWDYADYESVGVCLGSGARKLASADTTNLGIATNKETFVLPGGSTNKYQANKNYHWLAVDLGLT